MKKLAIVLLTATLAFSFVGCNKEDPKPKVEVEKEDTALTVEDYYEIVVKTLNSEKAGTISGEEIGNNMREGAPKATYTGNITNGVANIDVEHSYYMDVKQLDLEIDLSSPDQYGTKDGKPDNNVETGNIETLKILSLNTSLCEIEKNVMTCSEEYITEEESPKYSRQNIFLGRTNYTFEFDEETNDLIKYSIESIDFIAFVAVTKESTEFYDYKPEDVIILTEDEYTNMGKFVMDFVFENEMDETEQHIDNPELIDLLIAEYDMSIMAVAIYTNEDVVYK